MMTPRFILQFFLALSLSLTSVAWAQSNAPSQWQGTSPLPALAANDRDNKKASKFIILNSGGSGGAFGQGDIRMGLLSVYFYDANHGVACGLQGAYRSDNGGLTWTTIKKKSKKGIYYFIGMTGEHEIWMAHGIPGKVGGHLWHSTDNGKTWADATKLFPGKIGQVWNLLCHGQHVWFLGGGFWTNSYRSDDGGKTWKSLSILPQIQLSHYRVATPTSQFQGPLKTVYVLGDIAKTGKKGKVPGLARSDDAGIHWQEVLLPNADKLPQGVHQYAMNFATPDVGAIGMPKGGVLYTCDGGHTWQRRDLPGKQLSITALWLDPQQVKHIFAAAWNGFDNQLGSPRGGVALFESFDAGQHWIPVLSGQKQINQIFGFDSQHVWAVGDVPGFVYNDLIAILQ